MEQREQMFNLRCAIEDKVCGLIIDGSSCINVASKTLINKLQIYTKGRPTLYCLQLLGLGNKVTTLR